MTSRIRAAWLPFLALAWAMLLASAAPVAHAQGSPAPLAVEAVSGSMQGGQEVIRVEFNQPLTAPPTGFSIQSPARIALDVQGAANNLGRNSVEINQGNVRSVNVVQAGDRTRLVLNLKTAAPYKTEISGRTLLVLLDPVAAPAPATAAAAAPAQFAESRNRDTQPIRDLDFRRGADSAGRVIVDLANNQVGVDIRQQGTSLVVEFLRSSLPEGLRRKLDVTDFGTPVQTVTTSQAGDRVRLVIEPRGQWEHSAYQSDNQFVVEVRPQKVDPNRLTQGPNYAGEKLSLNFQNIEVRALLQVIADFTNFNVVTADSVTGSVTLRLKDVPWDQALDIILQARGLDKRRTGNVLWIAPKEEIAAREKAELESKAALAGLEAVRTQAFQLNYTRADDVKGQLEAGLVANRVLSSRGSAVAERRTNQLFVTDIPSRLEQVAAMIQRMDVAVRQVLIEARIVEASDTFGKSLGVRLGGSDLRGVRGGDAGYGIGGGNRVAFGGSYSAVSTTTGEGATALDATNTSFINLPAVGVAGFNAPTFAISLFSSAANRFLNLELSALEADGKGKLVSSPRIVTADQTLALIEQGTEFPYQQATASGATAVQFRKATLKLEVTPQITPEGNIILNLNIAKDSRGETTAAGIAINTKQIRTQVLVENGGTVVIGGIFELTETESEARVPLLGDLPGVGNLFKNRQRTANKQEMLVFITPKMITDRTAAR
jgi:type IV pilus assembly protein PilQ